jgi:release factor glutamine methyltransferase
VHVQALLAKAQQNLQDHGVEGALRDSRLLMAYALGKDISFLIGHPEYVLTQNQAALFEEYISERKNRVPVSRILGVREFWSMDYKISPDTLDPRPDTEILVEQVILWAKMYQAKNILDLGVGSGCILISLLRELPGVQGVGVDLNSNAINVAKHNAATHGVIDRCTFIHSSWGEGIEGQTFDIITSNPPYIPLSDLLEPEVALYDPHLALFGGEDGLECYRHIFKDIPRFLNPSGQVFVEIGKGQEEDVIAIAKGFGLQWVKSSKDLAGIERCLQFAM